MKSDKSTAKKTTLPWGWKDNLKSSLFALRMPVEIRSGLSNRIIINI